MAYSDWNHGVLSGHRCPLHLARLPDMDLCRGLDKSGLPKPLWLSIAPLPLLSAHHETSVGSIFDTQQLVLVLFEECARRFKPRLDS